MGWLIFLAILAALNCLPLGGRIRFDGQNFSAGVLIGKLPIRLYPLPDWLKRKMDRPKKEKPKKPQTASPAGLCHGFGWLWTFWELCGEKSGWITCICMWFWRGTTPATWR